MKNIMEYLANIFRGVLLEYLANICHGVLEYLGNICHGVWLEYLANICHDSCWSILQIFVRMFCRIILCCTAISRNVYNRIGL